MQVVDPADIHLSWLKKDMRSYYWMLPRQIWILLNARSDGSVCGTGSRKSPLDRSWIYPNITVGHSMQSYAPADPFLTSLTHETGIWLSESLSEWPNPAHVSSDLCPGGWPA